MEKTKIVLDGKEFIMEEVEAPTSLNINVKSPTTEKARNLTKEDVWGKFNENFEKISNGMIIARSKERCPIFGDVLPYKSVTVSCKPELEGEVIYWLEYVQGSDCISYRAELESGNIVMRANYQCW